MTAPHYRVGLVGERCSQCSDGLRWDEVHLVHETDCTMADLGYCHCDDERCAGCCPECNEMPA